MKRKKTEKQQYPLRAFRAVTPIDEYIKGYMDATGLSFSRVVQAALLQYFLGETGGPDAYWMQQLIALRKGRTTLAEIEANNKARGSK